MKRPTEQPERARTRANNPASQARRVSLIAVAALCLAATISGLLIQTIAHATAQASIAQPTSRLLTAQRHAAPTPPLYANDPCTNVYAAPSATSALLTQLLGGSDVIPLDNGGGPFRHVSFWSGVQGYIAAGSLVNAYPPDASLGDCVFPNIPDPQPDILPASAGPFPLTAQGVVSAPTTLLTQPSDQSLPLAGLAIGSRLHILAWGSDSAGRPWYRVQSTAGTGWVWSGAVRIDAPSPATQSYKGKPLWSAVAGKGMWFTNYLTRHSDMTTLLRAAKQAGLTHLYAEVAITQYGFYGRNSLDRLLPAAHAAGVSVIAWVYPTLANIAADARMTQEVAAYVTPSGDRADGIACDVEETDDSASVYSYGQLIRAMLPDALLVAAVYHPYAQVYYPYAAIAASWNVIAPMDYWHSRAHHAYNAAAVRSFVEGSALTIRAAMAALGTNAMLPIEELGQTYDMYSSDSTGAADAPTAEEMTADMRAAGSIGCIGVSFFEWQTTNQAEWSAITAYHW